MGLVSPFPHGTRILSIIREYLGLEGGPPIFKQFFTKIILLLPTNKAQKQD